MRMTFTLPLVLAAALLVRAPAAAQDTAPVEEPAVVVRFPDLEAARAAMTDETVEPYISTLQTAEMTAKTGSPITGKTLEAQRDECRKRYAAMTLQFEEGDQENLTWLAREVTTRYLADYPLIAETPWSFILVARPVEGGLPHTRGENIVFTPRIAQGLAKMRQRNPEAAVQSMASLLIHEQLHVVERRHPAVFEKLYAELWGFERVDALPTCEWLERNQVVNPDGIDIRWVRPFQRGDEMVYVHPRVVFADGDKPKRMPFDFRMVGIFLRKTKDGYRLDLDDDGVPKHESLLRIPEYRALFGGLMNTYHPNEALASLFPNMVISDMRGKSHASHDALRKWCRENFVSGK